MPNQQVNTARLAARICGKKVSPGADAGGGRATMAPPGGADHRRAPDSLFAMSLTCSAARRSMRSCRRASTLRLLK